jgi:hypothetical protein
MGWVMIAEVIGCIGLLFSVFIMVFLHLKTAELGFLMKTEGDLARENLNHIAGAIVGLSELLDEADEVIQEVSQIPTMGEMAMQMVQSFIMSKVQETAPVLTPFVENAGDLISEPVQDVVHGETENKEESTAQIDSV